MMVLTKTLQPMALQPISDSIRVVAGPGTGKSFGLKRRVARLLETGVPPTRILPVTFTNVAAEDLQREMLQIGVPGCEAIRGSTLHALGMKILGLDSLTAQERMALFKLFIDPEDRIALRWLRGFQSNDFRTGAYARIRNHCERTGTIPWDVMCQLETGAIRIAHTSHLVDRFRSIQSELADLRGPDGDDDISNLVRRWLPDSIEGPDDLRALVLDLAPTATTPAELLASLSDAIATPEIPPDVAQVRIMSLHKSKGLSSPVVVIAGCIEGLLPAAPDPDKSPKEQQADLEEQRRLLYVGLTRVKSLPESNQPGVLLLTYSRAMTLADAMQSGITPARVSYGDAYVNASRFVRELGPSAPRPRAA
jgi:DNA helicase II / ATP-dependent DNA helicase PcrA